MFPGDTEWWAWSLYSPSALLQPMDTISFSFSSGYHIYTPQLCLTTISGHHIHVSIKKAECKRIDTFELWCWRRFLRVPWTARRSNQSILKEISPEYYWKDWCWSWNSQYFGHLMWRTDSFEKTLMLERLKAGGEGDEDELVGWHHWLDRHETSKLRELVMDREALHAAVHRVAKSQT